MNNYIQDKIHQHTPIQDFESDCCQAPVVLDYEICSECKEHCDTIKEFRIDGKGYYNVMENDPALPFVEMCDIQFGYGHIKFKGTDKQLDNFLIEIGKNQMGFKEIGVHTIK